MADNTEQQQQKKAPAKSRDKNVVVQFVSEVRGEVRRVTWPTHRDAWRLTGVVLAATMAVGVFLWSFDFLFSSGFREIVNLFLGI